MTAQEKPPVASLDAQPGETEAEAKVRQQRSHMLWGAGKGPEERKILLALSKMSGASEDQKWGVYGGILDRGSDYDTGLGLELTRLVCQRAGTAGAAELHHLGHLVALVQQWFPRASASEVVEQSLALAMREDRWANLEKPGGSLAMQYLSKSGFSVKEALILLGDKLHDGATPDDLEDAAREILEKHRGEK